MQTNWTKNSRNMQSNCPEAWKLFMRQDSFWLYTITCESMKPLQLIFCFCTTSAESASLSLPLRRAKSERLTLYENIHISWEPLKRSWQAIEGLSSIDVMHTPDGLFSTKIVCNCSNFVSDCFVSISLYRPARFTSVWY